MEINATGIIKGELTDYLSFWTDKLREVYGNNFNIKKEGLIDNVATASSLTSLALEDVILYLAKQLNPMTAEGEFQDILYSYIGLERRYADFTVVTRTISGSANLVCPVGSIRVKNTSTDDIFELNTEVTLDANGKGVGSFTAIELGGIDLQPNDTLEIIDSPEPNMEVYYEQGNVTNIGDDYEDDSEFRLNWLATRSVLPTSKTEGGLRTALLDLVENENDLKIRQNRTNDTVSGLPAHSLEVIIKSGYSDTDIAQKILDHITDGVGIYGTLDEPVVLQDSEGTDVEVDFTRATEVPIYFKVEYVGKAGLESAIKNAIVDNFTYPMGERVIANDFYKYINDIDGLDYVTNLEIKKASDLSYSQTIPMSYNEYSTVIADNIEVSEYE